MLDAIILSEGTLRRDRTAQACLSWLEAHRPEAAERLYQELPEAAKEGLDSLPSVLDPQSWWCSEEAEEWWEDTLQEVMEGVAPAGYEFGVSEDDGADLGFWPTGDTSWDTLQAMVREIVELLDREHDGWHPGREKDVPDWLQAVFSAVQNKFSYDPYAMQTLYDVFDWIVDAEDEDMLVGAASEQCDIFNQDLLDWLSESNREDRVCYVDDVIKDGLGSGLYTCIQVAQGQYAADVACTVLDTMRQEIEA